MNATRNQKEERFLPRLLKLMESSQPELLLTRNLHELNLLNTAELEGPERKVSEKSRVGRMGEVSDPWGSWKGSEQLCLVHKSIPTPGPRSHKVQ